jgi:hypothetical protein
MSKRRERSPEWSIVFDDAAPLKSIVDAASAVAARVTFKVGHVDGHEGLFLMVDSADIAYMCCVSARLRLNQVQLAKPPDEAATEAALLNEFEFCVDCKHVSSAIDNPSCAHLALTLEGHAPTVGTPTVLLKMHDLETPSHSVEAELTTFVQEDPVDIKDIDFNMLLEIDLALLKEVIKTARRAHTEHLKITIYLKEVGAKKLSVVLFALDGLWSHVQKCCHEVVVDEDGSCIVRAATDGTERLVDLDALTPAFHGVYPIDKIDAFIKHLPCRMLTAKVETGSPLLLEYKLGGATDEASYIRFLVAAINEDAAVAD